MPKKTGPKKSKPTKKFKWPYKGLSDPKYIKDKYKLFADNREEWLKYFGLSEE